MSDTPRCIGFGDTEGKCENPAGSTHSEHWCQDCDDKRREHIGEQLKHLDSLMTLGQAMHDE